MTDETKEHAWYDIDASWDEYGYASEKLMKLGETPQWLDLVNEASQNTHATADEVWNGMATALRRYLELLDNLAAFNVYDLPQFQPREDE